MVRDRLSNDYLTKTFLSSPHRGVDNLEEELTGPRVEDEDGSIDGLGGQVTFKGLNNRIKGERLICSS